MPETSPTSHPGFLPTRGSFMLDAVCLAMVAVVAALLISWLLVRYRARYELHKRIQLATAAVLLVAITAFEVDLRLVTGDWRLLARASPYYASGLVHAVLAVHLCFAIPTPVLWGYVIVQALRKFPVPPRPAPHSPAHIFWARWAMAGMLMTAVTGWVFYWIAFVA